MGVPPAGLGDPNESSSRSFSGDLPKGGIEWNQSERAVRCRRKRSQILQELQRVMRSVALPPVASCLELRAWRTESVTALAELQSLIPSPPRSHAVTIIFKNRSNQLLCVRAKLNVSRT